MMGFGQQSVSFGPSPQHTASDQKRYYLLQLLMATVVVAQLLVTPAYANNQDPILKRLDEIEELSDRNNKEGIRQLLELKKNMPANASARAKLDVLLVLSGLYYDAGEPKAGNQLQEEFKKLAKELNDKDALTFLSIAEAYNLVEKSGVPEALKYLEGLAPTIEKSNWVLKYRYAATKASFYVNLADWEAALKEYLKMLDYCEKLPHRQMRARAATWQQMASLYLNLKDPQKALDATTEALAVTSANLVPKAYVDISLIRGAAFTQLKKLQEAQREYESALRIARHEDFPYYAGQATFSLADLNLILKDYKRAEQYARESMAILEKIEERYSAMGAQVNLGLALGYQGKVKQGADLVRESIEYFRKNSGRIEVEAIAGELAAMYESAGYYKEALELAREKQKLSEELYQSDRTKAVAQLQEQFEAEQRKKQIELLAKDNALKDADIRNHRLQQMVALLASVIAALAGCFIYMLYRRSKKLNAQLKEMNTQLEFHAVRDPLTGLHNRRSFITLMSTRVARVENERREGPYGNPDCMILLDIDHFKHINDTWGHSVGDMVLKEVATRLRNVVRDEDMVMRWGGEEFLIYSPKSNPEQITNLVERVLRTIGEDTFMHGNLPIPVTVTAGFISVPFSDVPEDICDWERALQIADMALYLGKTHGRNRAYGLARLLVPHEDAIPTLTHDLAAAIKQNMVEVIEVLGPPQAQTHV